MKNFMTKWVSFLIITGSAVLITHACKTPMPESELREGVDSPGGNGAGGGTYAGPPGSVPAAQNAQMWGQYCKGVAGDVGVAVNPNYQKNAHKLFLPYARSRISIRGDARPSQLDEF